MHKPRKLIKVTPESRMPDTPAAVEAACAAAAPPSRRRFFSLLLQSVLAVVLLPKRRAWAKKIGLSLRRTTELQKPGQSKVIDYHGTEILLVRDAKGGVHAINNTCTHRKCKVAYKASTDGLFCKCHRSAFKLDGTVVAGPAPRPLTTYKASLRGDQLVIDLP